MGVTYGKLNEHGGMKMMSDMIKNNGAKESKKKLKIEWGNRAGGAVEKVRALHRIRATRFHVRVVVMVEVLAALVLVVHRPIAFALHLHLPSQLLTCLARERLLLRRAHMWRRDVHRRRAISIVHG